MGALNRPDGAWVGEEVSSVAIIRRLLINWLQRMRNYGVGCSRVVNFKSCVAVYHYLWVSGDGIHVLVHCEALLIVVFLASKKLLNVVIGVVNGL